MQRTTSFISSGNSARRTRPRIAALVGLVLAGLTLLAGPAAAQTGPLGTVTEQPTPYHSPLFHSGGASTPYPLTGVDPLIDPLFPQLQGTPTGYFPQPPGAAAVPTQIPSFLLGNYDPLRPPTTAGQYYPEHFSDGINPPFNWAAPFAYVPTSAGDFTLDDSQTTAIATGTVGVGSVFAVASGTWTQVTTGDVAGTAAAGPGLAPEYYRLAPGAVGAVTWTLVASNPGSYSVYFHIPDNIDDGSGNVEQRNVNVTYLINVTGSNPQSGAATVSQTEANSSQFLAGPFLLQAGDTVVVTLQRRLTPAPALNNLTDANGGVGNYYLIADSMSLQTSFGDVQSTPTAINTTAYPNEFKNLRYWGIAPNTNAVLTTSGPLAGILGSFAAPDGGATPILRYGDPVQATVSDNAEGTVVLGSHLIRQLVYFGRSEPIFANQTTIDDTSAAFTPGAPTGFNVNVASPVATNGQYKTATAVSAGGTPASWTLSAPSGGSYSVVVNIPPPAIPTERRITDATYKVYVNNVQVGAVAGYPIDQTTQTGNVTLPIGSLQLNVGDTVRIDLPFTTGNSLTGGRVVVADSVTLTTGTTKGAIYCVDGFTGGVVWRYEVPGSANGPSAPVFSSPAVVRINVLTNTNPVTYRNRLVVIVGDNNGLVYCLDAVGNGDGTSNANAINLTTGQPIFAGQPPYDPVNPPLAYGGGLPAFNATTPHVGTTGVYWIYRPDANQPRYLATSATSTKGEVKPLTPNSDLPVPLAFGLASPTVFVDPTVSTTAATLTSNATVYVGNTNGVLYALDALGVWTDTVPLTATGQYGDTFNISQDLRATATDPIVPTCQPKWWFTLRGPSPNSSANTSHADIESAPALYVDTTTAPYTPHVYIGSAHEQESTSNVGRLYALNGLLGPSGNNGRSDPAAQPNPALANYTGPGSPNYNVGQKPQTNAADTTDWTFPDALDTTTGTATSNPTFGFKGKSSNGKPRPALGSITGSPVVFTNTHEATTPTRIYFAANSGIEIPYGSTDGVPNVRPDETQTGRIWAVNLDGSVGTTTGSGAGGAVWAYPLANDPNDQTKDAAVAANAEPFAPIGSFLHSTPAIGYVQFPKIITNGTAPPTPLPAVYNPTDAFNTTTLLGNVVPMLYIGTRGVDDTSLYAVDIDGDMNGTGQADQRTIYREVSPDGLVFQSSPVLITNATSAGGNGGSVLLTAGNNLYDFSATPISNPITTEGFPLIRENKFYTGFGPISGPAVAAADVSDLSTVFLTLPNPQNTSNYTTNATDWVYVGDSTTGYCKAITPNDSINYGGIPPALNGIVPPSAFPPGSGDLSTIIRSYLVAENNRKSTNYGDGLGVGSPNKLPAYEWGQNVYIRFANVVPPGTDQTNFVYDHSKPLPATAYGNGGPIEFDLSDDTADTDTSNPPPPADHGTVPNIILTAAQMPAIGFIQRTDNDSVNTLATSANKQWIGAYTYAISDGSTRRNTPGGHRQVKNARQTVHVYTTTDGTTFSGGDTTVELSASVTNGNVVPQADPSTGKITSGTFDTVGPVDQATFGILNPLGIRGGGIPLLATDGIARQIGDELGPFRAVSTPLLDNPYEREGLANGNAIYTMIPDSGTGAGTIDASPIRLKPQSSAYSPPTELKTVVTSTPLIRHNSSGDNSDLGASAVQPQGHLTTTTATQNGLSLPAFGFTGGSTPAPYSANIFDRSALSLVNKSVNVKMGLPANGIVSSSGLYWNENSTTNVSGHDAVVNYLPWEAAPTGYRLGSTNSSPDYPDISPQNVNAYVIPYDSGRVNVEQTSATLQGADFTAGSATALQDRVVNGGAIQIHIAIPHYQPPNQQLYKQQMVTDSTGKSVAVYVGDPSHEITPFGIASNNDTVFPMGYVTTRRIYVPSRSGQFQTGAAYRDIRVYTGVPVDMSTSIANPTTDIGTIPAAFGVQTQQFVGDTTPYTPVPALSFFAPSNPAFQSYFKPLEIHNDGNVNLLNVHMDQWQHFPQNGFPTSLALRSDAVDPLSAIDGYDLNGVTGPLTAQYGPRPTTLPGAATVPEQPFLIRSSVDTDLATAYGLNPFLTATGGYAGATFHKPLPGSDSSSILTVPDSPSDASSQFYLPPSGTGFPAPNQTAPPLVSLAVPLGTPVGTYATAAPADPNSLRLFEGLDTQTATAYAIDPANPSRILYPPQYGGQVGGIGTQTTASLANLDIYTGAQPLSTTGTQLTATVVPNRLTDGATLGAVPMIDATTANPGVSGGAQGIAFPDFAPAAFRDPASGDLSVYWTSGRSGTGYGIYGANLPFVLPTANNPLGYFVTGDPTKSWWNLFTPAVFTAAAPAVTTNSGLTIALDPTDLASSVYAFGVNVTNTATVPYNNTLYSYDVAPGSGKLSNAQAITNDPSQVKYGVRGLYTRTGLGVNARNRWAFWTASTRGRTVISYNATAGASAWPTTTTLLPIPAGLTSVADPSPLLMTAPVTNANGTVTLQPVIEVTYSGTGPDGNVDLYTSRYLPDTGATASKLTLMPYPQVIEILPQGSGTGWYQARDVAWSRTGALNVYINGTPILYSATTPFGPLFTKAIFDKASGLLVLTGISAALKDVGGNFLFTSTTGTVTVYVDAATGRVRFTGGTPVKTGTVTALFNPLAKRLTNDSRADTTPVTFLDDTFKPNDAPGLPNVKASRRWTIWRKSGIGGNVPSATLYYKTQRLTLFLPNPIGLSAAATPTPIVTVTIGGTDVTSQVDVDYTRGRIYFPIQLSNGTSVEGQQATVTYTPPSGTAPPVTDTVQWQDETLQNDSKNVPTTTLAGLNTVVDTQVPIDTAVNENNVAAFLDPFASATSEHKVWLFWNSTRNGTADIYSETINPLF